MKKTITKISFIAIMLCVVILAANCKKDDTTTPPNNNNPVENTTNYATYDGVKISFENAVLLKVEDYFYQQNLVNQFILCLTTKNVKYDTFFKEFNGSGNGVIIKFNSKTQTYFEAPDYTVDSTGTTKGTFKFDYYANKNFNDYLGFTSTYAAKTGTGTVTLTGNTYEVNLNCLTSNNKPFKAYYKGNLVLFIRDSGLLK